MNASLSSLRLQNPFALQELRGNFMGLGPCLWIATQRLTEKVELEDVMQQKASKLAAFLKPGRREVLVVVKEKLSHNDQNRCSLIMFLKKPGASCADLRSFTGTLSVPWFSTTSPPSSLLPVNPTNVTNKLF